MMQTQMELQKEMQKIMMQKMQGQINAQNLESNKIQIQKKEESENKGDENERLIEEKEEAESTDINLLSEQQLL